MSAYSEGSTITQQVEASVVKIASVLVCGGGTAGCVAAGTAAAVLSRSGQAARDIDVVALRALLQEQGVVL